MKWSILSFLLFTSTVVFSQGLKDIFLSIPDPYFALTKIQRDSLINIFLEKDTTQKRVGMQGHYLMAFDPGNGYLLMTGDYEGSTKVTYWNVSTGAKLIGIVYSSCGGACDNSVDFLLLTGGKYKEIAMKEIIPEVSFSDFMDISKMKQDHVDLEKEKALFATYQLLYHLPSKGKNIVVESQYQEMAMAETLLRYSLGSKIELVWQDGKFSKGKHVN